MLGWRREETRGEPPARYLERCIVDPAQVVCWTVALSQALAHGRTTYLNLPAEMRTELDGGLLSVVGVLVRWHARSGERLGALAQFHHSELHKDLDDVRTRFLSVVSHEFGSPVTNPTAAADLLADSLDGSDVEQWKLLRVIRTETSRLRRLLGQFLSNPSCPGEGLAPEREMITLPPVLRRVARSYRVRDPGREMVVQAPRDLPFVWGHEQQIEEVLANLVGNALRNSPRSRPSILAARAREDNVEISVADLGPGIPKERALLVREPPSCCERRGRGVEGNGLGLQITRTLVQAPGGELCYRRERGRGACLCFSLQRVPEEEIGYKRR